MTRPVPLSQVVGQTVELQRRTGSQHVGRCPFHDEQTPSFVVNDNKGTFHCLGCGINGNAADFAARLEARP